MAYATAMAEQPAADPVLAEATGLAGTAMFMTSGAPGMVLVVVRGDRSLVLGYGETEKGNKQTPDGNSLLRLNSITKVFTTEVLVSLAAEGKLIAAYSNVGYDLLADAIETAAGRSYPELLRRLVTAPLGMADTGFAPTPEQCARLMVGTGLGGAGPCVDTQATDGSGGLFSTGNDMARWLRHNIEDADGPRR